MQNCKLSKVTPFVVKKITYDLSNIIEIWGVYKEKKIPVYYNNGGGRGVLIVAPKIIINHKETNIIII